MKKPKTLTPQELKDKMDAQAAFMLVDVLPEAVHQRTHLKGSINIPLHEIETKGSQWLNRNIDIIVYSAGPNCKAAQFAQEHLIKMGYRVWKLEGGLEAWENQHYPLDGDPNFKPQAVTEDDAEALPPKVKPEAETTSEETQKEETKKKKAA
ncbi:MAG: hypothetical protein A3B70_08290 [Deltaproteobacteria bacterium RIFCSPHIGHO2_02_FULL_40_11]|nr:MAG: hypothetical protein A3B70_08290 [Deltaproteobacteria bacterium RIFCSPHIGHO2_02_FULL_40_11]